MLYQLSYVGTSSNPSTHSNVRGRISNPNKVSTMERVMGIEPTPSAWKAEVLPLNYTRAEVVEGVGFEPTKA